MNDEALAANWSLSAEALHQAVVPATGFPASSVQENAAAPQSWTSRSARRSAPTAAVLRLAADAADEPRPPPV